MVLLNRRSFASFLDKIFNIPLLRSNFFITFSSNIHVIGLTKVDNTLYLYDANLMKDNPYESFDTGNQYCKTFDTFSMDDCVDGIIKHLFGEKNSHIFSKHIPCCMSIIGCPILGYSKDFGQIRQIIRLCDIFTLNLSVMRFIFTNKYHDRSYMLKIQYNLWVANS